MTAEAEAPVLAPATPRLAAPGLVRAAMAAALLALCLAPFALVVAISFGEKIDGAAWRWAFSLSGYQRFFLGFEWPARWSDVYLVKLYYSLLYAALGSAIAVAMAFPFALRLARQSRRAQTLWLVFILSALSLSEVFVVMGWDVLLSQRSGLPMLLREAGVTAWLRDNGWFPLLQSWDLANPRDIKFKTSVFATALTMVHLVFPYAVILLYPALSRLDPSLAEAARTMGARPLTVLRTVILPAVWLPVVGAGLLLFVYLLGAYVVVSVFAAPARQTLTVTIYDSVRGATLDAPFGAAQSVVLLVVASAVLLASGRIARRP